MERAVAAPSSPAREGTLPVDLTLTDGLLAVADDNVIVWVLYMGILRMRVTTCGSFIA